MDPARHEEYVSPFSARYTSPEISYLFSAQYKFFTFRRLWLALAKSQKELGLPITEDQIQEMEAHLEKIDFEKAASYEKKFRHDVMAHIHTFGDLCPSAKSIIHLGATSTYVTDNGDLVQMREALSLLLKKLVHVLKLLAALAEKEAATACLAYTHFQTAQPTTVGKRACLWLQDFLLDAIEWERQIEELPFLGAKGATGTQASFLALFEGNAQKVEHLERLIAAHFGFKKVLPIAGQTYSRKLDLNLLNALESFAASAHKMATDLRLLAHEGELTESFGKSQVGSSAMPYKRNPIYAERICGIARFVMSLSQNPAYTAATQWLERTLDDSSNRRLSLPEAFLGTDSVLNLLIHLLQHLEVHHAKIGANLAAQVPKLSMENLLMLAVKRGGDRQEAHEVLRNLSFLSTEKFLEEAPQALHLKREEIEPLLRADIGCAPSQVHSFLQKELAPFLSRFRGEDPTIASIEF